MENMGEILKLNSDHYQRVTCDRSGKIRISTPWYGKILVFLGFHTIIDKKIISLVNQELKQIAKDSEGIFKKLPNLINIRDDKRYLFYGKKFHWKVNREKNLKKAQDVTGVMSAINSGKIKISIEDKKELLRELVITRKKLLQAALYLPCISDLSAQVKFNGSPSTQAEQLILDFYRSKIPELGKAKTGYELIERSTRAMDVRQYEAVTIKMGQSQFECFDISKTSYQFIVHSTSIKNTEAVVKRLHENQMGTPNLCTSLVNQDRSFYEASTQVALVLALDPKDIIATFKRDMMTPSYNPATAAADVKKMTEDFYNFYEKISVLIGYIDHIYRASSCFDSHLSDAHQRYTRLSLLQDKLISIKEIGTEWNTDYEKMLEEVSAEKDALITKYSQNEFKKDPPQFQLHQLIKFYESRPDLANSPDEYKKLFGHRGDRLLVELKKALVTLDRLKATDTVHTFDGKKEYLWRSYFNKTLGPSELLSVTAETGTTIYGATEYNEINVRLDNGQQRGTRPVEAKALIIKKTLLKSLSASQDPHLEKLLNYAQDNQIPILIA